MPFMRWKRKHASLFCKRIKNLLNNQGSDLSGAPVKKFAK
jgi:hypothetical protein